MRSLLILLRAALAGALLLSVAFAADSKRKSYDIPAGDAGQALREFSAVSGLEVLFAAEAVRGVRTAAVRGDLTAQEAIELLLADTGLTATQDRATGAFAVRKAMAPKADDAAVSENDQSTMDRTSEQLVTLKEFTVTGSRLRTNSGEYQIQPVQTFTSLDIERTGAANLAQLFQYIPAVTSYTTGIGSESVNSSIGSNLGAGQTPSRTNAQLRGGSQNETLLLIDGKRVPLTALRASGGNGYDLGVIPLAAIERVEVLLDGASAIYGADAVNGVINVILKKNYSGTEVRFNYDNTFDTDSGVMTASLTHGFARGKWSGLVTLSAAENNVLLLTDRYLTRSFDRTIYGGITNQSQPTTFAEGTGSLAVLSGVLPGTSVQRVSIPANYDGGPITVADYVNAPAPQGGITPGRQSATSYNKDRAAFVRLGYDVNDRLALTGTARLSQREFRNNGVWRRVENVTIPAGYAGNPFGVPVRLSKTFYDLPPIVNGSETEQKEITLTATGKLLADWRYEADFSFVQGTSNMLPPELDGAGGQIGSQVAPSSLFTSRLNAEIAAGRNPILIYDSNSKSPNSPGALDPFWVAQTQTKLNDRIRNWTYSAQADGKVFSLPGGDINAVIGAEARVEKVDFDGSIGGTPWAYIPQRDVTSVYAEARIPLVGPKQDIPFMRQLDFNLAARTERYSDFGRATTPRYGLAWRPFKPVLLRGSYGEGFLAPQLYRLAATQTSVSVFPFALIYPGAVDLSRGNTPLTGIATIVSGGNPDLKPQQSESLTYGLVFEVPKIEGLSLSFDYFDNRFTDAFGTISDIMDRQRYSPETILRGPNLPGDPAGWPGPIIGYDTRNINISSSRTAGYSYGVRYRRETALGELNVNLYGEKTLSREERIFPNATPTPSANKRFIPQRATLSVFWARNAWDAGVTGVYGGKFWVNSSNQTIAPSRYTDDVMRWDINMGYDFGRRPGFGIQGDAWWRRALHDTKFRVTIINVFDQEPPLNVNGSFSSSVIDMRLRRYIIDVTKRF
ncbi:MAG: TonB-dependent receptor [Cephaloticoccus sp.]|nr:TonB-dependent receptor [Cephaloticoccus sp.]